jgi:hypothetical protein
LVTVDLPGNASAATMGLVVSAAGRVRTSTVVLLSPGEIDEAVRQKVEYRAPGAWRHRCRPPETARAPDCRVRPVRLVELVRR